MATCATASIHNRGVSPRLTPRSNSSTSRGISAEQRIERLVQQFKPCHFGIAQIDDDAGALGRLDARLMDRVLQRRRLGGFRHSLGLALSSPHRRYVPRPNNTPGSACKKIATRPIARPQGTNYGRFDEKSLSFRMIGIPIPAAPPALNDPPAIDLDDIAGEKFGIRRSQIERRIGNILRLRQPAERHRRNELLALAGRRAEERRQ